MQVNNLAKAEKLYREDKFHEAYKIVLKEFKRKELKPYRKYEILRVMKRNIENKINLKAINEKPKFVSVITINFNNLNGIKKTIESVSNQTARQDIEYIVVDGSSTDGSIDYLRSVTNKVDIGVYGNDKGIYDAMNRAISIATGKYCIFMNSGDCFDTNEVVEKVKKNVNQLSFHPQAVYGHTRRENGSVWEAHALKYFWKGMKFSHQSVFIDTKELKHDPYDDTKKIVADYLQLYKLYITKGDFHFIDMTIGNVEDIGVSGDIYSRTTERWMAVREVFSPEVTKGDIDEFYRSYLSTADNKYSPSFKFEANKAQNKLISNAEERIIFLISMPRSGSTLLQKILEQSEQINTLGEPWLMLPLLSSYDDELIEAKYGQHLNILAKDDFLKHTSNEDIIKEAQQVYADSIYSSIIRESEKRYFLDKTPRYIYIVSRLKEIYPKAKFIVLLRNPAPIISSYAHTWYRDSFNKLAQDKYCRNDFEKGFSKLSEFVQSDFKNKFVIRYEDLVSQPEKVLPKLFKYLNLNFNENYINYNNKKEGLTKFRFGDPSTVYSKSKPDASHADKWVKDIKENGTEEDFLNVLDLVPEETIASLGYDKTKIIQALGCNVLELVYNNIGKRHGSNETILKQLRAKYQVKSKKTLGVLITSFNNKLTIITALMSVAEQSQQPDLIVVADDCSTDNSVDLIQNYIVKNPKIKIQLLARKENMGVSKNRDLAIRGMKVDYISTLDGDDIFYSGKLEAEYLVLEGSESKVSFSNILVQTKDKEFIQDTSAYSYKTVEEMVRMIVSRSAPVPRDMMFPKSLFIESDGFDHELSAYEDWALKCRMMANSTDNSWVATGVIGTIYDRKTPGLSSLEPIMHVTNQLLVLSRNLDILKSYDKSLNKSLLMLGKLLNGNMADRFYIFSDYIGENGVDMLVINNFESFRRELWGKKNVDLKDAFSLVWNITNIK